MAFDLEAAGADYLAGMGRTNKYIRKMQANAKHPGQRANARLSAAASAYQAAAAPGGRMERANTSYGVAEFNQACVANAGRLAEGGRKGLAKWKKKMGAQMAARDAAAQAVDAARQAGADPVERVRIWIQAMKDMAGKT